jgi:hypothetical protein
MASVAHRAQAARGLGIRTLQSSSTLTQRLVEPGKRAIAYVVTRDEPDKGEISSAQKVEHRMMEIEQALNSPSTADAEKAELERKYADAKKMMAKIHAEQEAGEVRSFIYKVEKNADARKFEGTPQLARIKTERVSAAMAQEVLARAGVKDTARRIREVASSVDEHVQVSFDSDGRGRIVLVLLTR